MPNTDEHGNKIAAKKEKKSIIKVVGFVSVELQKLKHLLRTINWKNRTQNTVRNVDLENEARVILVKNSEMKKRTLSQLEEKIIRLVHHDFVGLSLEETAHRIAFLTVPKLKQKLRQIEKLAPQLFPILTPQHRAILLMYDKHMSRASIAVALGISKQDLCKEIAFLRKHKFLWNRKMDQYDPLMDGSVKERF